MRVLRHDRNCSYKNSAISSDAGIRVCFVDHIDAFRRHFGMHHGRLRAVAHRWLSDRDVSMADGGGYEG